MRASRWFWGPMVTLMILGACGGPAKKPATGPPAKGPDLGQRHPLNGRIWDARARTFIKEATLVQRLARARLVFLGEKHDNRIHHQLQARVLAALVAQGEILQVVVTLISST